QIQQKSDQMNNLNCNSGGCGGHVSECQSLGDQIKQLCNQDNALMQQIAAACSAFSGGQSSQRNCN
ncbi:MAG TPA: hypothetical protein VNI01_11450, partial [Elusimicrobiota bacterium]|nr:hypothetical protein [Elusimicrobiota bacterium]